MTFEISITVDTNDGDPAHDVSDITQAGIDRILPIIEAIKKNHRQFPYIQHHKEDVMEEYPQFSENDIDNFLGYCPYTEYGFHTIESIYIYPKPTKKKLL